MQTQSNGTYIAYGLFASNQEGVITIKDVKGNDTIIAYGCNFCNDYGRAKIEKKGNRYTIKEFENVPKFLQIAKVLELNKSMTKATLQIDNNKPFLANVKVKQNRGNAFFIDNQWILQ